MQGEKSDTIVFLDCFNAPMTPQLSHTSKMLAGMVFEGQAMGNLS